MLKSIGSDVNSEIRPRSPKKCVGRITTINHRKTVQDGNGIDEIETLAKGQLMQRRDAISGDRTRVGVDRFVTYWLQNIWRGVIFDMVKLKRQVRKKMGKRGRRIHREIFPSII